MSPFLVIIAILIKCSSKGPVFFLQERIGKQGKVFKIIKFRTMVMNAEKIGSGVFINEKNDDRITKVGRFLRSTSLDELPQLFNVLVGDMSLAYIIYIVYGCKENKIIAIIQTLTLVSCLTNINWLFFGLEMFKITVTRNTFIRIGTVICILTFVNDTNDLPLYTGIMLVGSLISELILFWFAKDKVYWVKPSTRKIVRHLKPNIVLFIPLLAMSVYHTKRTKEDLLKDLACEDEEED